MSIATEYDQCDAVALAELVRSRQVHPMELVDAAIQRIESLNPQLNAIAQRLYDDAREAAQNQVSIEAPFCGVPFLMKDLLSPYAGAPMRCGSRLLCDYVPPRDGEMTRRFKAAGLIAVGKTTVPEFGLLPVTESRECGATLNPWDLGRTPGGSSGGSAAAVAARIVPLAHANDGGGSIRIPAACCGLFGLKPTRGRTPIGPDYGEAWQGLVADHVVTRSVRDSAAMLDAVSGPELAGRNYVPPPDRRFLEEVGAPPGRLRIAFTSQPWLGSDVHSDCLAGLSEAAKLCESLGHDVTEQSPKIDGEAFRIALTTLICAESAALVQMAGKAIGRRVRIRDVEPSTWLLTMLGRGTSAAALSVAHHTIHESVIEVCRFFEDYDVLLTPTLAAPPIEINTYLPTGLEHLLLRFVTRMNLSRVTAALGGIRQCARRGFNFGAYTPLFNATGQPAMSVPLHWSEDNLPIGMQFVGRFGDEATLLRLAAQLEEAQPWDTRLPPILDK